MLVRCQLSIPMASRQPRDRRHWMQLSDARSFFFIRIVMSSQRMRGSRRRTASKYHSSSCEPTRWAQISYGNVNNWCLTYHWKEWYISHHPSRLPVRWLKLNDHMAVVVKKIRRLGFLEFFPPWWWVEHVKDLRQCEHSNQDSAKSDSLR